MTVVVAAVGLVLGAAIAVVVRLIGRETGTCDRGPTQPDRTQP